MIDFKQLSVHDLECMGIRFASSEETKAFIAFVTEEFEVRVGEAVSAGRTAIEMEAFQACATEDEVEEWLNAHCPDYKKIVENISIELENELVRYGNQIAGNTKSKEDNSIQEIAQNGDSSLLKKDEKGIPAFMKRKNENTASASSLSKNPFSYDLSENGKGVPGFLRRKEPGDFATLPKNDFSTGISRTGSEILLSTRNKEYRPPTVPSRYEKGIAKDSGIQSEPAVMRRKSSGNSSYSSPQFIDTTERYEVLKEIVLKPSWVDYKTDIKILLLQIAGKQFNRSRRGYLCTEVDSFLAKLMREIEENKIDKHIIDVITNTEFYVSDNGYGFYEVDDFLDEICDALEEIET